MESNCNSRFKSERVRLGFSQQRVADETSVTKRSVVSWELETNIPIQKLASLLPWGFDIQYIASGVRSQNVSMINKASGRQGIGSEPTTKDEIRLLRTYRALGDLGKEQMMIVLKAFHIQLNHPELVEKEEGRTPPR